MVKPTQPRPNPLKPISSPSKRGQTHPNPAQTHPNPPQTHPNPLLQMVKPILFPLWDNTLVPTRRCRLPQAFQYYTNDFLQSVNAVTWNRWACKKLLLIYLKTCCAGNIGTSNIGHLCRWCHQQNVLGNMEKRGTALLLVPKCFAWRVAGASICLSHLVWGWSG